MADVLSDVLTTASVSGAVSARTEGRAPWGLHFEGSRRADFHIVSRGTCWLRLDGDPDAIQLFQGDVVLLTRGTGYVIADDPGTPTEEFAALAAEVGAGRAGVLTVGGSGTATGLVCGSYAFDTEGPDPFLHALPPLVHLPADPGTARDGALDAAVRLLSGEVEGDRPGSRAMVNRLVDVLLIDVLRAWLDRQPEGRPGWLGALRDPQIGEALSLVHESPGRRWTVASLGASVGLSRAAFARRFNGRVGEPPMSYLARWRMTLAAGALRDGGDPLATIADRVGYDSEFAFAKAFKRLHGEAPGRYRARYRRKGNEQVRPGGGSLGPT